MSSVKIPVQNDNDKDVKKNDIPKQTSLDTTVDMHADEDEEKNVCRSVLYTEEEHKARRDESKADIKDVLKQNVSLHGMEFTVAYNQPPAGQGGWFQQGPPPPPPPYPQQQQQGWGQQGPPPQQQQGWFQQGPPPPPSPQQEPQERRLSRFGNTHPRRSDFQSSPPLDYSEDKEDRNAFVRKVMIILMVMLLVTSVFMVIVLSMNKRVSRRQHTGSSLSSTNLAKIIKVVSVTFRYPVLFYHRPAGEPVKRFFRRYFLYIALPTAGILIVMSCIMPTSACARKSPTNYICLVIVTILESLVCCAITSRYRTIIILEAFIATLIAVAFCVILACTKFDFTRCILIVMCVSMALTGLLIVVIIARFGFGVYSKPLMIVILVLFTILNMVMLIIELQMVLGGKSVEIGEEDYALGAYMLYTSIIHLFLNLVQLLGIIQS